MNSQIILRDYNIYNFCLYYFMILALIKFCCLAFASIFSTKLSFTVSETKQLISCYSASCCYKTKAEPLFLSTNRPQWMRNINNTNPVDILLKNVKIISDL